MARRRKLRTSSNSTQPQKQTEPRSLPRPESFFTSLQYVDYSSIDDEEFPTRNTDYANNLIRLIDTTPELGTALETICTYALSSGTGDEMGFAVVEDENNPQPEVVALARDLITRSFDIFGYWQVLWRMVAWGDAFIYLDIDTKQMRIESARLLPTWQVHAIPDDDGSLHHYEQRFPGLGDAVIIPPVNLIQLSYNRRYLYGRSIFHECVKGGEDRAMADANFDLKEASRTVGVQPNIHTMPQGVDENYKRAYKEDHEARRKKGLIPDIYLLNGARISTPEGMPSINPLGGLMDHFNMRLKRIAVRSRVPLYLLGIETRYAREIATQPAIAFVVFVGTIRQFLSSGLRQLVNTELALKGIPPERWAYRFVFPQISLNPY
jgi:hypothetical protein